ncbi:MAG: hypothetical protein EOM50_02425 [Erysipelotrichia bacterium]|nr:hypothetical protein [Erysipelotrichia bacterium]NCC55214.1 hypothetical protein [Erysipelotrichia bacterium]
MQNLSSLLLSIFGVILFIWLLPTFLWIILIVALVVIIYVNIQKMKYRKYMKDMEDMAEDYHEEYQDTYKHSSTIDSDVIDVEYTESEEKDS